MMELEGQYIPTDNSKSRRDDIIFIGEKPSQAFIKHPEKRLLGNYNATPTDIRLQKYIRKYLGQVYITDMVKTEGRAGAAFEKEWELKSRHKEILAIELERMKPKKIGALGRKVESLLKREFPEYANAVVYLIHPAATRFPKNLTQWDTQFEFLAK